VPAALLFAVPALTPGEALAMRADLAMYTLRGRTDFMRRFAPGVGGGGDAAEPNVQRMADGTVRTRITTVDQFAAAMKQHGGRR